MKRRRARWHALSRSRQRPLPHLDKERSENVEVGRGDIMKKLLPNARSVPSRLRLQRDHGLIVTSAVDEPTLVALGLA
jgi:hypothetical protein